MRLSDSFGFALFSLLLREKHPVFLLICLFLLITKVFIKFKQILFRKNIRLCAFKGSKVKFKDVPIELKINGNDPYDLLDKFKIFGN